MDETEKEELTKIDITKDYKAKKAVDTFDDKYIKHKCESGKKLSIGQYLGRIRLYLRDMMYDLRTSGAWKTQLTAKITFMLLKDSSKSEPMHSKSTNIEIMIGFDTDQIINFLIHFDVNIKMVCKHKWREQLFVWLCG